MDVYVDESHRITYVARGLTTGAVVRISIWKPDGIKDINSALMTELGEGLYYYDYTPKEEGVYQYIAKCEDPKKYSAGDFKAVKNPWDMKKEDHNTYGTLGYVVQHISSSFTRRPMKFEGVWTQKEKEKLLDALNELFRVLNEISLRLEAQKITAKETTEILKRVKGGFEDKLEKIFKNSQENKSSLEERISVIENKLEKSAKSRDEKIKELVKLIAQNMEIDQLELALSENEL